ncbi:MAG: hypothetical protein IJI08_04665, partial [Clostridia bacterium]|nr:hypothetical protein [Clostridia bacterium]
FVLLPAVYFRQLLTSLQDRNILFYKGFMQTYSVLISGQNAKQQKRVSRLRPRKTRCRNSLILKKAAAEI